MALLFLSGHTQSLQQTVAPPSAPPPQASGNRVGSRAFSCPRKGGQWVSLPCHMDRQHQIPPTPAHKFRWPEPNAKLEQPGQREATSVPQLPLYQWLPPRASVKKRAGKTSSELRGPVPTPAPEAWGFGFPALCQASAPPPATGREILACS